MHRNSNSRDVGSLVLEGGGRAGRFGRLLGSYFRADRAGIVAFGVILLLCASFAHAQTGIRWDLGAPGSAGAVTAAASGGLPALLAQPGVTLAWCNHPANAVPCTNYATTYTSLALSTPCATNAQIVLQGSTTCQAQSDFMGDLGVYTATNTVCTVTCYDYTLTVSGISYGPYVWTQGGGASSGGSLPTASAADQVLVSTAPGTTYAAQTKPVIDARAKGVDCTGATASDAALAFLATTDSITSAQLQFPGGCQVHVQNTILVKNQASFSILGVSRGGAAAKGVTITCVGGGTCTGGPIMDMEYTDGCEVAGITFNANGLAAISLNIDKTGAGGVYNTTDCRFHDNAYNVGSGTQAWTGVYISQNSTQNVEDIRVTDSAFFCNARPGNYAQYGVRVGNSQNAKNEIIRHNNFTNCFYHVWQQQGSAVIEENEFTSGGGACATGTGADIRLDGDTDPVVIRHNLDENGTQFFNCDNDAPLGGCNTSFAVTIDSNHFSPAGCENTGKYWINAANSQNPLQISNNGWDQDAGLTKVIGTATAAINRPLWVYGNNFPNQAFTPWWTQAPGQGQTQEYGLLFGNRFFTSVPNGGAFPSAFTVWRAYLTGSTYDDFAAQTLIGQNNISTFLLKHVQGNAGGFINLDAPLPRLVLSPISAPLVAPGISNQGVAGSTSYTYAFVPYVGSTNCVGGTNAPGSPTTTTATGNANLTSSNYNEIHFLGVPGASEYGVWRTASAGNPASTGMIACISALQTNSFGVNFVVGTAYTNNQVVTDNNYRLLDTGLAGDSAGLPGSNSTGGVTLSSYLFANLPALPNGTMLYCSDCKNVTDDTTGTFDSAAAGAGHGTNVLRENGAWRVH